MLIGPEACFDQALIPLESLRSLPLSKLREVFLMVCSEYSVPDVCFFNSHIPQRQKLFFQKLQAASKQRRNYIIDARNLSPSDRAVIFHIFDEQKETLKYQGGDHSWKFSAVVIKNENLDQQLKSGKLSHLVKHEVERQGEGVDFSAYRSLFIVPTLEEVLPT